MKLQTIVAAVQAHDDLAKAVLRAAQSVAGYGATIHVVSAWPIITPLAGFGAEIGAMAGPLTQETITAHREARAIEEQTLRTQAETYARGAEVHLLDGEPGDVVGAFAEKVGADIIVVGSHQKGFWGSLVTGASSKDVLRDAPCGVLVVTKPFAEKLARQGW